MPLIAPDKVLRMVHAEDPADVIRKKAGDLSKIRLMSNNILVGIYVPPEKTQGGLYLPDRTRTENRFQGKAGLVLAMGSRAFKDDEQYKFHGEHINIGDWVFFRPSDGWEILVNEQPCRMFGEAGIRGVITEPDDIF